VRTRGSGRFATALENEFRLASAATMQAAAMARSASLPENLEWAFRPEPPRLIVNLAYPSPMTSAALTFASLDYVDRLKEAGFDESRHALEEAKNELGREFRMSGLRSPKREAN
jgi:hypothetical protein